MQQNKVWALLFFLAYCCVVPTFNWLLCDWKWEGNMLQPRNWGCSMAANLVGCVSCVMSLVCLFYART